MYYPSDIPDPEKSNKHIFHPLSKTDCKNPKPKYIYKNTLYSTPTVTMSINKTDIGFIFFILVVAILNF